MKRNQKGGYFDTLPAFKSECILGSLDANATVQNSLTQVETTHLQDQCTNSGVCCSGSGNTPITLSGGKGSKNPNKTIRKRARKSYRKKSKSRKNLKKKRGKTRRVSYNICKICNKCRIPKGSTVCKRCIGLKKCKKCTKCKKCGQTK